MALVSFQLDPAAGGVSQAAFDNHTHAYRKITQIGADTSKFYDGPTRTDIVDNSEVFVSPFFTYVGVSVCSVATVTATASTSFIGVTNTSLLSTMSVLVGPS